MMAIETIIFCSNKSILKVFGTSDNFTGNRFSSEWTVVIKSPFASYICEDAAGFTLATSGKEDIVAPKNPQPAPATININKIKKIQKERFQDDFFFIGFFCTTRLLGGMGLDELGFIRHLSKAHYFL